MNENVWVKLSDSFIEKWHYFINQVPQYILGIVIITVGVFFANKITQIFRNTVGKRAKDPLMSNFLAKTLNLVLVISAIMLGMYAAGLQGVASALLTAAGASAVIIGFAFRDIGENFIAGVILSFNRPFDLDDTVMIDNVFGMVKEMEFRYTKLKTFDGRDVYIPNSDVIKKAVFNYTEDGYFRLDFVVGIKYEDRIARAEEVILKAINGTPGVVGTEEYPTFIVAEELAVSTVNLKVFFWVETKEYSKKALSIKSQVIAKVKKALIEYDLTTLVDTSKIKASGPPPLPPKK